jgi:hypothetical protein
MLQFLNNLNKKGIPLPLLRDPTTSQGSVSLTMMVTSFAICIVTLAGKITKVFGEVEYANCLWLFGICSSLYFGRKLGKNSLKGIKNEQEE